MKKKATPRPLRPDMNDSYSPRELYAVFESQVFARAERMDVPLLRETVLALDEREDAAAAPHREQVWRGIIRRIMALQKPYALGLSRRGFAILIAALILLTAAAAYAITNWNAIIERVYSLEKQESRVENWTLDQKQAIWDALKEAGYDMSSLPDVSSMTDQERDAALTQWLNRQFEGEVTSKHYNLMIHLNGFFDDWSLTDKAWYDQMRIEGGDVREGDFVSSLPPDGEENGQIALALAREKLHEAYDGTDVDPDTLTPSLFYGYLYPDDTAHYWRVHYRDEWKGNWFTVLVRDTDPAQYEAQVTLRAPTPAEFNAALEKNSRRNEERQAQRERLEAERGLLITWTHAQQAEMNPKLYGVPGPNDITPEEAYAIARRVYCETTGASPEEADKLYCFSFFMIDGERPYYSISLFYDAEAYRLAGEISIAIYSDGEIKSVTTGSNG